MSSANIGQTERRLGKFEKTIIMSVITVPSRDQVSAESQVLFDILQKRVGKVPNLYATMGYSPFALKGFLDFDETLSKGVFNGKEREAIALIVSEVNGCEYCLAAHTMLALKRGYSKPETLDIRKGEVSDPKLSAIILLAKAIVETRGYPANDFLVNFYAVGFNEAALMELVGLITVRIYTNYVFALSGIPLDFPAADPI
jgi:AhpD family alkylhydroperoxidase